LTPNICCVSARADNTAAPNASAATNVIRNSRILPLTDIIALASTQAHNADFLDHSGT
jgi:hypothetical protein